MDNAGDVAEDGEEDVKPEGAADADGEEDTEGRKDYGENNAYKVCHSVCIMCPLGGVRQWWVEDADFVGCGVFLYGFDHTNTCRRMKRAPTSAISITYIPAFYMV